MGEGLVEFKVKDSDFLPLLRVLGCVVEGWPVRYWVFFVVLLASECAPRQGSSPPYWKWL